jgi:hypothetical protein
MKPIANPTAMFPVKGSPRLAITEFAESSVIALLTVIMA